MVEFDYLQPASLEEALSILAVYQDRGEREGVCLLAGGTDLVPRLNRRALRPKAVVDLSGAENMRGLLIEAGRVRIGALVTHTELTKSAVLAEKGRILAQAAGVVGSPQIRNRGTIGGNLANASPAADTAPALMVLGARVKLARRSQERFLPLEEFFLGPGRTAITGDEVISEIIFDQTQPGQGASFHKLGKRNAQAISVASAAVFVEVEKAREAFKRVRIALGAVGPTPLRLKAAEEALIGQPVSHKIIREAAQLVAENIHPITDIRATAQYRKMVAAALFERAMLEALAQAGYRGQAAQTSKRGKG